VWRNKLWGYIFTDGSYEPSLCDGGPAKAMSDVLNAQFSVDSNSSTLPWRQLSGRLTRMPKRARSAPPGQSKGCSAWT
jgi:hypothetical protein